MRRRKKRIIGEASSTTSHPLVTLIHFTRDGEAPATSGIIGTWKASRPGKEFVYKFDKNGSVSATAAKAPAALRGYWFQDARRLGLLEREW